MSMDVSSFVSFVREKFNTDEFIPLHAPVFMGNEKMYVNECIESTFVSSVGKFVDRFEEEITKFTGAKYAVATVNGTAALHIALLLAGVERDDEVITQPLTFVATCNAMSYIGAYPIFVDVDKDNLGLSPEKLEDFLSNETTIINGACVNKTTGRKIKAVVPMHTFGNPLKIVEVAKVCSIYGLKLIEDSAESLGSFVKGKHTGTFGTLGVLSFNGNKTITTGGGGMILTDDESLAKKAKHMTTTAKIPHAWEYDHDMIGYNYRLPNINSALGCAQMELLPEYLKRKRELADSYKDYFMDREPRYVLETKGTTSNYWLNAIVLDSLEQRNEFLQETNQIGIMTRPIWKLMSKVKMFENTQKANLDNAEWLESRVVNIPSSVIW